MKKNLMRFCLLITAFSFMFINGCQKEDGPVVTDSTPFNENSVEKNAFVATASFDDLNNFAQSGFDVPGTKGGILTFGTCPVVSVNFTALPYSVNLDWGNGCQNIDGKTRSGSVSIGLTGLMTEKNSSATLKIENFVEDGKKISGTTKITYQGPNPGNNWPRYSIVSEGKIEFADKTSVKYRSEGVRLQAEGSGTTSITDDVWRTEIQSASGENRDGLKWTAKTTKVMIRRGDCKWYNSGTFEITPETGLKRTIDFGDGTCDDKATLKIGDLTTEIKL